MHVWFNWQHLELNLDAVSNGCAQDETGASFRTQHFGKKIDQSYQDLDMFMLGGVIFF